MAALVFLAWGVLYALGLGVSVVGGVMLGQMLSDDDTIMTTWVMGLTVLAYICFMVVSLAG